MGSHRRARIRGGRRRGGWLAGAMLVAGAAVLVLAVVRADVTAARLATGPAPSPAPAAGTPAGPLQGTWVGPLDDPDTATVEVRLTVAGPGHGIVVEVPSLRCTYRGPDPDRGSVTTADVRGDPTGGPGCVDTARVRLGAAGDDGPAADRVRYELLDSCEGAVCAPRRATGVLTARR